VKRLGAVLAVLCLGALSACSGNDVDTSSDPVEVEVGKAFSWNGFTVDDGWTLEGVQRSVNGNEVTTPNVKGSITNTLDDERAAIFEMVFSADSNPVATISCSAPKMVKDQSQAFECPGLSATMPEDYDAVVVQTYVRDTGNGDSGTTSG
jgi:ABC-type glycerol-3-phosphate transport system substrate-binding protein